MEMPDEEMDDVLGKFREMQEGMKVIIAYADLLNMSRKRISRILEADNLRDMGKLANALAKDRIDWMMTDMVAITEELNRVSESDEYP